MKLIRTTLKPILVVFLLTGLVSMLIGQETTQEEVFELSPFIVDSSTDDGYLATQSQAGTRTKADLRDIAASISVMTPELLEDIGATDMQDALAYSVSTENEFEYAPNDGEGESTSTLIQSRTRGLVSSTTSRNFFQSRLRLDGYNTERLTLARGPNSILFGIGSPAGTIDGTLKRARDSKKVFGSAAIQFDSYGGHREVMDVNAPVLKDVFAIRVGILNQEKATFREPEVDDERRHYATFTLKPWKGATFRGYYEKADIQRIMGRQQLAYDYISDWIAEGRPLWDYSTGKWTYDNGSTWESWRGVNGYPEPGASGNRSPVYIVDGGAPLDVSVYDSITFKNQFGLTADELKAYYMEIGTQAFNYARVPESWNTATPQKTFSDGSIIPLDVNLNGENSMTDFDVEAKTATYEQQIGKNFFIELAYNNETFDNYFFDSFRGENIYADVSYYLPITTPLGTQLWWQPQNQRPFVKDANNNWILIDNPNRGQFYNESATIGRDQTLETETYRATVSYELDLTDVNRWLGRYNIAGMWQEDRFDELSIKTRLYTMGDDRNWGWQRDGRNTITNRAYINLPGISPATDAPPFPGEYVNPSERYEWWDTFQGGLHDDGKPELAAREVESLMGVVQGYWDGPWGDSLVATLGIREDEVDVYGSTGIYRDDSHIWQLDTAALTEEPTVTYEGSTKTMGLVYHTPAKWLSVFYNKSDNFRPHTNKRNVFGEFIAPQEGEGEDWGFLIETFDRKLTLRFSAYENSAKGALSNNYSEYRIKDTVITYMESAIKGIIQDQAIEFHGLEPNEEPPYFTPEEQTLIDQFVDAHPDTFTRWLAWNDEVRTVRDYEAKGYEMELFARPMRGLDVRLTVAKTESKNTVVSPVFQEFLELRMPVWEKYYNRHRNTDEILSDWETNTNSLGWRLFNEDNRYPQFYQDLAQQGLPSQLNRKWRANLIVNYRFREGALRGWSTGLGARWREKAAVGFMPMPSPYLEGTVAPDVTKPVYGKDQMFFDIWFKYQRKITIGNSRVDWTLYLKVANPFESSPKVVPYEASFQLDGAYSKYQVEADRRITISNKISF